MTDQHAAAPEPHDAEPPGQPGGARRSAAPGHGGGWGDSWRKPGERGTGRGTDADTDSDAPPGIHLKLRRDRRHKVLGGVCAGLGRRCDMDPVIFRIGLAVLAITGGVGLVFYGFAWLLIPYEDTEENEARRLLSGRVDGPAVTALLFALVGCGLFLSMLNNGGVLTFAAVLALLLAGAGYWSEQRSTNAPDPVTAQTVADAPPEAQAPPVSAAPSWWRGPIVKDGTYDGYTGYFWGPPELAGTEIRYEPRPPWAPPGHYSPAPRRPAAPAKPPGPRWIGGWTFLLALVAGGIGTSLAWGNNWREASLGTSLQTGLACALVVFGLGIAVSALFGRTGVGSMILGVITAGLLAGASALPANISTEWMRTDWTPAAIADVRPNYELGTGIGTLDLSGIELAEDQTLQTGADVGAGRVKVIVPHNVTVQLNAEVGIGDIQLPSETREDVDIQADQKREVTLRPPEPQGGGNDGGKSTEKGGTLALDIELGIGQVEVTRATP
ncbi:PspC domain-containing protein [Streptomyces apocyni]|uniref:PspC domain-containing protein n=1 Tax=Streptomyces apocyni TaxID=2654677 RepID=UPI0012EA2EEE|nr:PspC domain-containing protein [Streptomyces apocyni]